MRKYTRNTILVIDDNNEFRAGLIEILGFENYATLEAENGGVGLQMIHQYAPALILCDVDMPIMNGIEVLRKTKSDAVFAKIPFIIMTGRSDETTFNAAQTLGVAAYMIKPVDIVDLLSTVSQLLMAQISS